MLLRLTDDRGGEGLRNSVADVAEALRRGPRRIGRRDEGGVSSGARKGADKTRDGARLSDRGAAA